VSPIYCKSEDVVARQIAGETLLVPVRGDLAGLQRIFALDKVAQFIWERLDGQSDLDDICAAVVAEFEVCEGKAQADAGRFIAELLDAGLIAERS